MREKRRGHIHTYARRGSRRRDSATTVEAAVHSAFREIRKRTRKNERRKRDREKGRKQRQTLSREEHDARRGCKQRVTTTGERNDNGDGDDDDDDDDNGYTRAAPPTLDDVIPPAATWSPPTYVRANTNTTTRTTHNDHDGSRPFAISRRNRARAPPNLKNVCAGVAVKESARERIQCQPRQRTRPVRSGDETRTRTETKSRPSRAESTRTRPRTPRAPVGRTSTPAARSRVFGRFRFGRSTLG